MTKVIFEEEKLNWPDDLTTNSKKVGGSIRAHILEGYNKYQSRQRRYFWSEVAKHDTPDDCWVVIHGKVYDVTKFLDRHPGGYEILSGAGGDMTEIFEFTHPLRLTKVGPP